MGKSAVGKRILIRIARPRPNGWRWLVLVAHQPCRLAGGPGTRTGLFHRWVNWDPAQSILGRFGRANDPAVTEARFAPRSKEWNAHLLGDGDATGGNVGSTTLSGHALRVSAYQCICDHRRRALRVWACTACFRRRCASVLGIGVRMALGAGPVQIFGWWLGRDSASSVAGIAAGLIGAFVLTRLLRACWWE